MSRLSVEAKVGLLVIAASLVLLYMTFAVGKYEFGEKKGYLLQAVFDSVAGVDTKAAIRMAGVKIGAVEKVELEGSRARITMRIDPGVQIARGSEAMIKTMGLLGEKYVEFMPGRIVADSAKTKDLQRFYKPGDQVQATISPSDVDKLINQLSSISDDVKQVTQSLRNVLGTPGGERSMQDILRDLRQTTANIREFSATLRTETPEMIARMNDLMARVDALTGKLGDVVDENRGGLHATVENVKEASKSAELALASIDTISKKLERGEGTIGKLLTDEGMYNNIDGAARGLSDYLTRVERMKTVVGFRSEYMFPDAKSYATIELRPQTDKYYILEITSDPFANYSRTITTTTPPGNSVVTETYENKFKFTAEFAKRWGNLAIRLGLIESTGGAGADYYAYNDRFKFSLDTWNYSSREQGNSNAHLKATAHYEVNKTVFVNAGYDNALNVRRRSPFVGIGLKFNDDDLKYLLGSVPVPK